MVDSPGLGSCKEIINSFQTQKSQISQMTAMLCDMIIQDENLKERWNRFDSLVSQQLSRLKKTPATSSSSPSLVTSPEMNHTSDESVSECTSNAARPLSLDRSNRKSSKQARDPPPADDDGLQSAFHYINNYVEQPADNSDVTHLFGESCGLPSMTRKLAPLLDLAVMNLESLQSLGGDVTQNGRKCQETRRSLRSLRRRAFTLEHQLRQFTKPVLVTSLSRRSARAAGEAGVMARLVDRLRRTSRKSALDPSLRQKASDMSLKLKALLSRQKCEWQCVGRLKETLTIAREIRDLLRFLTELSSLLQHEATAARWIQERPPPYEYWDSKSKANDAPTDPKSPVSKATRRASCPAHSHSDVTCCDSLLDTDDQSEEQISPRPRATSLQSRSRSSPHHSSHHPLSLRHSSPLPDKGSFGDSPDFPACSPLCHSRLSCSSSDLVFDLCPTVDTQPTHRQQQMSSSTESKCRTCAVTADSPHDVILDSDVIMMADNDVIDVDTELTSGQQQQADTTFILNQEVPCATERKLTLMSEILNERHEDCNKPCQKPLKPIDLRSVQMKHKSGYEQFAEMTSPTKNDITQKLIDNHQRATYHNEESFTSVHPTDSLAKSKIPHGIQQRHLHVDRWDPRHHLAASSTSQQMHTSDKNAELNSQSDHSQSQQSVKNKHPSRESVHDGNSQKGDNSPDITELQSLQVDANTSDSGVGSPSSRSLHKTNPKKKLHRKQTFVIDPTCDCSGKIQPRITLEDLQQAITNLGKSGSCIMNTGDDVRNSVNTVSFDKNDCNNDMKKPGLVNMTMTKNEDNDRNNLINTRSETLVKSLATPNGSLNNLLSNEDSGNVENNSLMSDPTNSVRAPILQCMTVSENIDLNLTKTRAWDSVSYETHRHDTASKRSDTDATCHSLTDERLETQVLGQDQTAAHPDVDCRSHSMSMDEEKSSSSCFNRITITEMDDQANLKDDVDESKHEVDSSDSWERALQWCREDSSGTGTTVTSEEMDAMMTYTVNAAITETIIASIGGSVATGDVSEPVLLVVESDNTISSRGKLVSHVQLAAPRSDSAAHDTEQTADALAAMVNAADVAEVTAADTMFSDAELTSETSSSGSFKDEENNNNARVYRSRKAKGHVTQQLKEDQPHKEPETMMAERKKSKSPTIGNVKRISRTSTPISTPTQVRVGKKSRTATPVSSIVANSSRRTSPNVHLSRPKSIEKITIKKVKGNSDQTTNATDAAVDSPGDIRKSVSEETPALSLVNDGLARGDVAVDVVKEDGHKSEVVEKPDDSPVPVPDDLAHSETDPATVQRDSPSPALEENADNCLLSDELAPGDVDPVKEPSSNSQSTTVENKPDICPVTDAVAASDVELLVLDEPKKNEDICGLDSDDKTEQITSVIRSLFDLLHPEPSDQSSESSSSCSANHSDHTVSASYVNIITEDTDSSGFPRFSKREQNLHQQILKYFNFLKAKQNVKLKKKDASGWCSGVSSTESERCLHSWVSPPPPGECQHGDTWTEAKSSIYEVKAFDSDWTGTRMMMTIPPWIRYFITTGATIGLGNALMKLYNSWLTNDLIDIEQMYHVTGAFDDFDLGRV